MNRICNFFKKYLLFLKIWIIKIIWNKYQVIEQKVNKVIKDKKFYEKMFIQSEEDRELNKEYLESFNKKILKLNQKELKIRKKIIIKLYKLDYLENESNFLVICYNLGIESEKISFLRDIKVSKKFYLSN